MSFHTARRIESLVEQLEEKNKRIAELERYRDSMHERFLSWLGVYPDSGDVVCDGCGGKGQRVYGNTSTYFNGIGGQAMTNDICDKCWGSGKSNEPFRSIKRLKAQSQTHKARKGEL